MKILEILAFVSEPKSSQQITERFGKHWQSNMKNLVRKGCVDKIRMYNENSGGWHQLAIVTGYKATGIEYKTHHNQPGPRREYNRKYYEQVRKAKKNATQAPQS